MQERARDVHALDPFQPERKISSLDPYEHLKRSLRICVVHFRRGVKKLADRVGLDQAIINVMHSLASPHPINDYDGIIQRIAEAGDEANSKEDV